jgi:pimeloyl-ACP methyl ester carboxylesterase
MSPAATARVDALSADGATLRAMTLATIDLDGPVHYADFGGAGPPLVLVHGLDGSLANWMAVAGALTARFRVFAPDLLGFGRTPLAGRSAGIAAQTTMLARFVERVAGGAAVIVGNSMGGLVAAHVAADRPELAARLVLVSAALPGRFPPSIDPTVVRLFALYMTPYLGPILLRRHHAAVGPEGVVREILRLCGIDVAELPPEIQAAEIDVARARVDMPWAHEAFVQAARSLVLTLARRGRARAMLQRIVAPTLLIYGSRDRLVGPAVGEATARLRPDWPLTVLQGVGHVPQLEVPERWLVAVTSWLDASSS